MAKSPDAFRTISEVAEWLGVPAHVLRFWESKFSQVRPIKRAGGRRYYRPADMLLLGGIRKLLHEDGMTIKGVQKLLREKGVAEVAALSQPLDFIEGETVDSPPSPKDAPGPTVVPFKAQAESQPPAARPRQEPTAETQIDMDLAPPAPPLPPDPPAEEDLACTEGRLARLARIGRPSAEQAAALASVARELRAWTERQAARAGPNRG